jgi:hypothetical protein
VIPQDHERTPNDLNTAAATGIFIDYSEKAKDCYVMYDPRTNKKVVRGDVQHVIDRAFITRDYFMSLPSYSRLFSIGINNNDLKAFRAPDDSFNNDIDVDDLNLTNKDAPQAASAPSTSAHESVLTDIKAPLSSISMTQTNHPTEATSETYQLEEVRSDHSAIKIERTYCPSSA